MKQNYNELPNGYLESINRGIRTVRNFRGGMSRRKLSRAEGIARLKTEIETADAIVIGAGAGLSTAAGFIYSGERFEKYFGDFARRFGIRDMYSGGFYPFPDAETRWAWWARHIYYNRYIDPPKPVYKELLSLIQGKDYFVITTNVDGQFIKAGFEPEKVFEVQGDYGLIQCATACHPKRYSNESLVKQMVAQQKDCRIPSALVPRCPVCGGPMEINVRKDLYFVEDDRWHLQADRYYAFLEKMLGKGKLVLLEYGVGYNTPTIIRFPFERMAASYPDVTLIRINKDYRDCQTPGISHFIGLETLFL